MANDRQQAIVVGVSASPASRAALSWAAEEARLRGAKLHVVRAWEPARPAPYAASGSLPTDEEQRVTARDSLVAVMQAEFGPVVPDRVTFELARGVPERVLVDRSAHAGLLVLGVTTPAWRAGRPAGPVVRACVARARCPVVIIGGADETPALAGRPLSDAVVA
jgi:nucleotide-binding universal stress UspA family protein